MKFLVDRDRDHPHHMTGFRCDFILRTIAAWEHQTHYQEQQANRSLDLQPCGQCVEGVDPRKAWLSSDLKSDVELALQAGVYDRPKMGPSSVPM